MIEAIAISPRELKRLQTLYSQFAAGDVLARTREQRLAWAALVCNRELASFSEMTTDEAATCIERLQAALNDKQPGVKSSQRRRKKMRRQIADRQEAKRFAMDGRHDGKFQDEPQIAGRYDLDVIEGYYMRLGWGRAQFEGWLRSPRSPLGRKGKENPEIRTVADANRVRWALVKMLRAAGLWAEKKVS